MKVAGGDVTALLHRWRAGDEEAEAVLLPLIYQELHRLAARSLGRERQGHTLRPTDLVSEAYLRLAEGSQPDWNDRLQFFAIASRMMRRILIDHARRKGAEKRGNGLANVEIDDELTAEPRPLDLVALDDALVELAKFDERKARAVELVFFGGLNHDEVAATLEVHPNTVTRDLQFAKAWIRRHMQDHT